MGSPIRGGRAMGALLATVMGVTALPGSAGAQAFSPTSRLATTAEGYQEPQVSALGSEVHVAWLDASTGNGDVYYRRSVNGGTSFGPARNLSEDGITPGEGAGSVRVLAHGDRVYVTWVEGGLRFRASKDRGATFGPVLELTGWPEGGLRLAAAGDDVYMGWYRSLEDEVGDIGFIRGVDGGRVFADLEDLNENRGYGSVELAAQGEHVYVVWDDGGTNDGSDLFFRRSTDGGRTFEPIQRLTQTDAESDDQQLAVQGSNVYVVWNEWDWPTSEVWLRKSTDGGATFGEPVKVSQAPASAFNPRLVVRDSRVFVAWTGQTLETYEAEVYLSLSVNGGASFAAPVNVSGTAGDSRGTQLVPFGTGVRLAWTEGLNGEREVHTRATVGYGLNLGPAENLSQTPGDSGNLSMASSRCGAQVHVVWLEGGETPSAVLYRRATLPFSSVYCLLLPEPR